MEGFADSLLSNMENKDMDLVIEAAKLTGFSNIVYIETKAFDCHNRIIEDYCGVHTNDRSIDYHDFWVKFDELEKKRRVKNEKTAQK